MPHIKHSPLDSSCAIEKYFLIKLVGLNNFIGNAYCFCPLRVNLVDKLTALAQVARQQKRLDARIQWLAAFSQVSSDVVIDLSCDFNVANDWTIFTAINTLSSLTHMLQSRKKYKKAVSEHNALLEDPAELLRYNLNA